MAGSMIVTATLVAVGGLHLSYSLDAQRIELDAKLSAARERLKNDFERRCGAASKEVLDDLKVCTEYAIQQQTEASLCQAVMAQSRGYLEQIDATLNTLSTAVGTNADSLASLDKVLKDDVSKQLGDVLALRPMLQTIQSTQQDVLGNTIVSCDTSEPDEVSMGCDEDNVSVAKLLRGIGTQSMRRFSEVDRNFDASNPDGLLAKTEAAASGTREDLQAYIRGNDSLERAHRTEMKALEGQLVAATKSVQSAKSWPNEELRVRGQRIRIRPPHPEVQCAWMSVHGELVGSGGGPKHFDVQEAPRGLDGTTAFLLTLGSGNGRGAASIGSQRFPARLQIRLDMLPVVDEKGGVFCEATFADLPDALRDVLSNGQTRGETWDLRVSLGSREAVTIDNTAVWSSGQ